MCGLIDVQMCKLIDVQIKNPELESNLVKLISNQLIRTFPHLHICTSLFPPLLLLYNQAQFSSGLSFYRSIFLCPAD